MYWGGWCLLVIPEHFIVDDQTTLNLSENGNTTLEDVFFFDSKYMIMTRWIPTVNNSGE